MEGMLRKAHPEDSRSRRHPGAWEVEIVEEQMCRSFAPLCPVDVSYHRGKLRGNAEEDLGTCNTVEEARLGTRVVILEGE